MIRKKLEWKFRDYSLELGPNTLIVGVLNVTPDSFSDGGSYAEPEAAVARALDMQEQGADIIDIGAESTKPGSERVSEAEELRRLIPVLKRLKGKLNIPISVDTYKVAVAEAALEHGAHIINDPSGLTWEPELAKTVLHNGAGLIINHMRGTPETWAKLAPMRDVMGEILAELEASLHRAVKAGVPTTAIVVDPGIGFGKRKEQNSEIIARLREMSRLPVPILVGPSRKAFLAQDTPEGTEFATAAAVTAAILNGAYLVRVHDVAAARAVVGVADAILVAIPEKVEAPQTRVARRNDEGQMREVVFGDEAPKRPVQPPALRAKKKADADVKDLPLMRRPVKRVEDIEDEATEDAPLTAEEAQNAWEGEKPRRDFRDEAPERPARAPRAPREDRPVRSDDRPPFRRDDDRPPRRDYDRPAGDRPAYGRGRPAAGPGGDRPPAKRPYRRDDDDRGGSPSRGGGGSRPPAGGRPPFRRDDDRPPSRGAAGPPTKRPYRRDDDDRGGAPRGGSRPPAGGRPPFRRDDDRPPSRGAAGGAPTKRPYRRDDDDRGGPPRGGSRPPAGGRPPFRRDDDDRGGPPRGGARPPAKRPFRRDDDDRGPRGSGGGSATKRPFRPGGAGGAPPKRSGPGGGGRGPSTPRKRS